MPIFDSQVMLANDRNGSAAALRHRISLMAANEREPAVQLRTHQQ